MCRWSKRLRKRATAHFCFSFSPSIFGIDFESFFEIVQRHEIRGWRRCRSAHQASKVGTKQATQIAINRLRRGGRSKQFRKRYGPPSRARHGRHCKQSCDTCRKLCSRCSSCRRRSGRDRGKQGSDARRQRFGLFWHHLCFLGLLVKQTQQATPPDRCRGCGGGLMFLLGKHGLESPKALAEPTLHVLVLWLSLGSGRGTRVGSRLSGRVAQGRRGKIIVRQQPSFFLGQVTHEVSGKAGNALRQRRRPQLTQLHHRVGQAHFPRPLRSKRHFLLLVLAGRRAVAVHNLRPVNDFHHVADDSITTLARKILGACKVGCCRIDSGDGNQGV
jgi:hypothetical protein